MARWLQVEVDAPAAALAVLEPALEAAGAVAVSLEDPGGPPLLEPAPGTMPLWDAVRVVALFEDGTPHERILVALAAAAVRGPPRFSVVEERNWIAEWQASLAPLRFGARLWVLAPGVACPDPAGVVVRLEPGIAFGTGTHATTALCLEWLAARDLRGQCVLDYGCGSGILAIAALALGAARAVAVDVDEQALEATRSNAARNGCGERLRVCRPGDAGARDRHDCVVANILSGTLVALAPTLHAACRAGAGVALSGILAEQGDDVRHGCRQWFDLRVGAARDGWLLLTGAPLTAS